MKKDIIMCMIATVITSLANGQGKYLGNNGEISFYSHTIVEDITAINNKVAGVIDAATGEVAVIVKMVEFSFVKELMQEHFNENYVESVKFPKSTFTGTITNNTDVDYTTHGKYKVLVEGELTLHGVKKVISTEGTVEVTGTGIVASTKFILHPADFKIKIPKVVRNNIAKSMEVTVSINCNPI